jgi:hypothetical protein
VTATASSVDTLAISSSGSGNSIPLEFQMNRAVKTVGDLWREWVRGIHGGPSVEAMDRQWGARWRRGTSEAMYYSRRKTIIDAIRVAEQRIGAKGAVTAMEGLRMSRKWSLDKLGKQLRAQKVQLCI